MFFPARKGTHPWDGIYGDGTSAFNYWPNGTSTGYEANYLDEVLGVYDSGGAVTITEYGAAGQFVSGNFTIDPAGYYLVAENKQLAKVKIEGRFKLKRTS